MKAVVDLNIAQLMKTKRFSELSKTELERVEANYSAEEYEAYYLFFQSVATTFKTSAAELELPDQVKTAVFNAFKKEKKAAINRYMLTLGGGLAAAAIFSVVLLNLSENKPLQTMSTIEFNTYTQQQNFGIDENALDEVSITLQDMDFSSTIIKGSVPSCTW